MKKQLMEDFHIEENKVTVIPFGINNIVPVTGMKKGDARNHLGIQGNEKVLLFFGRIAPYKGLDLLVSAFEKLVKCDPGFRLIIAGQVKDDNAIQYWGNVQSKIKENGLDRYIIKKIEYIPDDEIELYFKSSDVLILPYKHIFQTGVLFISYFFGLPAVATDVGSFRDDILEGETGFVCRADDPLDLSECVKRYFDSDIYRNVEINRPAIRDYSIRKYSWEIVSEKTRHIYGRFLA
jgi:glycosyltransferase involved in cell wall biosynthesis